MRFDQVFTFFDCDSGMVHTAEGSWPLSNPAEMRLLDRLSGFTEVANKDWARTHILLPTPVSDNGFTRALERYVFAWNMWPPARDYALIYAGNRKLMQPVCRKFIVGSGCRNAVEEYRKREPKTLLFGTKNLNVKGYRNVSDVPKDRLILCLKGLFVGVVKAGPVSNQERDLIEAAAIVGLSIEEMNYETAQ